MNAHSAYRIRGAEDQAPPVVSHEVGVQRLRRVRPGGARGSGLDVEVHSDEVARVELENGFVLWTRVDDLVREKGRAVLGRGGAEAIEIDMRPRRAPLSRGLLGLGIRVLDFFGVDLKGKSAALFGEKLEARQLRGQPPGLYRLGLESSLSLQPLPETPQGGRPLLLFIHGTASSCGGSFGKLWAEDSPKGAAARLALRQRYGDGVFAFEHRSLTRSPIDNALELARALPAGAELHLVTHSRGGLVGELLCLGELHDVNPLNDDGLLQSLFATDRTIAEQIGLDPLDEPAAERRDAAYAEDLTKLLQLRAELADKGFRISRFVRVACPARGTTLASGRLDRWLSVLGHLGGPEFLGDVMDFLLAVVKERTDPRVLPGLEAMMPGSALTRLLVHPDLVTRSDLTVIAGDIDGDSLWSQIKLLATDWFYGGDHDLVVNTGSMFGGIRRPEANARFALERGPAVHHFGYFSSEASLTWMQLGLLRADGSDGGFQPLAAAPHQEPRWRAAVRRSRAGAAPKPLAVLLPGTMGSALQVNGEEVWLNYWRLLRGGLRRLHLGATGVEPTDLLDDFYGPLLEFLASTHRLEIFPYDWRFSVRAAARRLATKLEDWLPEFERRRQPVHLVAHSMGGLVVRAMIADGGAGTAVWRRICALPQSRLLMLGTPNRGSYEAVRWLTGYNPTQAKLSLLDIRQSTNEIIEIVRYYPGLIELLPFDDASPDFSQAALWQRLKSDLEARWTPVEQSLLADAAKTWRMLKAAVPEPGLMLYVAGCQPETVAGYRVDVPDARPTLKFIGTGKGDGTVTWQSGLLPGVGAWYAEDTSHDELCVQQRNFPGYLDLLMTGTTTRLPASPPAAIRGGAGEPETFLMPELPVTDGIPDENDLRGIGFGPGRPPSQRPPEIPSPQIRVSIIHGDLAYAKYPVLVGHYAGDTIVSAEAALDRRLNSALSRRLQLGLYPGDLRSHAIFDHVDSDGRPAGALVIGLGQVGELSPGLLEAGVRNAMLDFALQRAQRVASGRGVSSVRFSCMLVGSGMGGMTVRDSVESILRGAVGANKKLVDSGLNALVLIDRLEFLELFEDVAIAAAEALANLTLDGPLAAAFAWPDGVVAEGQGGRRRVRFDGDEAWWHRLEIIEDADRDLLRFIAVTDRARAEETQSRGQLLLAEGFIREASQSPASNADVARTLFEMLLPGRLKELSPRQANLVVLVDETSARYPWELLEDRWGQSGRPPAVAGGFIRQLKTRQFRPAPAHAFEANAYVVGNPNLDGWALFPDLPGARHEAQAVARLLASRNYQVAEAIDQKAAAIVQNLHRDAWRILHLCGHGEHEFPLPQIGAPDQVAAAVDVAAGRSVKTVSGMVIGRDTFLTPGDVEQMRWVPELVFINCCHLGRSQGGRGGIYQELAANLAVQFIRMGVKAVVAAGWAVDDAAATAFAESFYTHLLANEPFGEAVRAAREEVWMRFPGVNTWGAYQCYGDPAFRVSAVGIAQGRQWDRNYHAPAELVNDLRNLAEAARMGHGDSADADDRLESYEHGISDMLSSIPENQRDLWLVRADVASALGIVWGELGMYHEAIRWLETALAGEKADMPVCALERYIDFLLRAAGERTSSGRRGGAAGDSKALVERIKRALALLEFLCGHTPTLKRLCLMGSASKRLALLQGDRRARLKALADMAGHFRQAFELSGCTDPYAFANLARAKLLALALDKKEKDDGVLDECNRMNQAARVRNEAEPGFWNAVAEADCELAHLLVHAGEKPEAIARLGERVASLYRQACARGASPHEIASVRESLDFVIEMNQAADLRDVLDQIRGAALA